jgi:hypothetical protein
VGLLVPFLVDVAGSLLVAVFVSPQELDREIVLAIALDTPPELGEPNYRAK